MADTLYINSDNLVSITGLYDSLNDLYVNTATVTCQLQDAIGTDIGSPFNLEYVDGSNGGYEGTLDDADVATLQQGCYYVLVVSVENGESLLTMRRQAVAMYAD